MYRDTKSFKERFLRWKNGESVYEAGRPIPKYADGKDGAILNHDYENDVFTGARLFDGLDIVVTGTDRRPKSRLPRTSTYTNNYQKWDTADLLQSMITGSDVGDAVDIGTSLYNKNYTQAAIGAGLFALPNVIEKPLKYTFTAGKKLLKPLFGKKDVVKTAQDWLSEVTDEEIAQYINTHPMHLNDKSLFVVGADNMPSELDITGKTREDLARLAVARNNYIQQNPQIFLDVPFGGYAPLENFMSRNNLTLNDILSDEIPFETVLDKELMSKSSVTKWANLMNHGIMDAYIAAGGTKRMLGPDDIDDLVYLMAKGDPFALAVRKNMIKNYSGGLYSPMLGKISIGKPNFITRKVDGLEVINIPDQIKYAHEYGHLLTDKHNTATLMKKEIDAIRKDLKQKGLSDNVAAVTGFDPLLVDEAHREYLVDGYFDEILQRISLWKDALGIRDPFTQLTGDDVRNMMQNYVKMTGKDNNITDMVKGIVNPDKFANFFSKYAKAIVPATIVTGLSVPSLSYGSNNNDTPSYRGGKDSESDQEDVSTEYYFTKNPLLKWADPTGISSYPDVYDGYINGSNTYDQLMNILQSIPMIGKVPKILNTVGNIGGAWKELKEYLDIKNKYENQIMIVPGTKRMGRRGNVGSSLPTGPANRAILATPEQAEWYRAMSDGIHNITLDYSRTKGKPFDGSEPAWMLVPFKQKQQNKQ